MKETIAIFGGTGTLGKYVVRAFLTAGHPVRLLVRNRAKATDLISNQATLIQGDLADHAAIADALTGATWVYCSLSGDEGGRPSAFQAEREGLANILSASNRAGIGRIGYLSGHTLDLTTTRWWVYDMKRAALNQLKQTHIPYLIFKPSSFMESLTEKGTIRGNAIQVIGRGNNPVWFIAANDFAGQVCRAFQKGLTNREYIIQGPETHSFHQAALALQQALPAQKLVIRKTPVFVLTLLGLFVPSLGFLAKLFGDIDRLPEPFAGQLAWDELGKPQTTLARFLDRSTKFRLAPTQDA